MRRRLTIVMAGDEEPAKHQIVPKGAFDSVLDICSLLERDGTEVRLDDGRREELRRYYQVREGRAGASVPWQLVPLRQRRNTKLQTSAI